MVQIVAGLAKLDVGMLPVYGAAQGNCVMHVGSPQRGHRVLQYLL